MRTAFFVHHANVLLVTIINGDDGTTMSCYISLHDARFSLYPERMRPPMKLLHWWNCLWSPVVLQVCDSSFHAVYSTPTILYKIHTYGQHIG